MIVQTYASDYAGLVDWFKKIFGTPTIKDLPPEQQAKIHEAIKHAQIKGLLIGALAGAALAYFMLHSSNQKQVRTQK